MAMHTVKTKISVDKMELFRTFLKANNLDVVISYYPERVNSFQTNNYIEFAYSDKEEETMEALTFFKMRYNGVESAFQSFYHTVDRIRADLV
jgi:hypothetical protein